MWQPAGKAALWCLATSVLFCFCTCRCHGAAVASEAVELSVETCQETGGGSCPVASEGEGEGTESGRLRNPPVLLQTRRHQEVMEATTADATAKAKIATRKSSTARGTGMDRFCGIAINSESSNSYSFSSAELTSAATTAGAERMWHYNWKMTTDVTADNVIFVPMIKYPGSTGAVDVSDLPTAGENGVGTIVKGWNEPDDTSQAGSYSELRWLTSDWSQSWVDDMSAAAAKGYTEFISPAMAKDPIWMDYFLASCSDNADCPQYITYLAFHRYRSDCGDYSSSSNLDVNDGWRDDLSYIVSWYRLMVKYNALGFNIKGLVWDEIGCMGSSGASPASEQLQYMQQWYIDTLIAVKNGDETMIAQIQDALYIQPYELPAPDGTYATAGYLRNTDDSEAAGDSVKAIQSLVSLAWFSINTNTNYLFASDDSLNTLGSTYFSACSSVLESSASVETTAAATTAAPATTTATTSTTTSTTTEETTTTTTTSTAATTVAVVSTTEFVSAGEPVVVDLTTQAPGSSSSSTTTTTTVVPAATTTTAAPTTSTLTDTTASQQVDNEDSGSSGSSSGEEGDSEGEGDDTYAEDEYDDGGEEEEEDLENDSNMSNESFNESADDYDDEDVDDDATEGNSFTTGKRNLNGATVRIINDFSERQLYATEGGIRCDLEGSFDSDRGTWKLLPKEDGYRIKNVAFNRLLTVGRVQDDCDWGSCVYVGEVKVSKQIEIWSIDEQPNGRFRIASMDGNFSRVLYAQKNLTKNNGLGAGWSPGVREDGFWRLEKV